MPSAAAARWRAGRGGPGRRAARSGHPKGASHADCWTGPPPPWPWRSAGHQASQTAAPATRPTGRCPGHQATRLLAGRPGQPGCCAGPTRPARLLRRADRPPGWTAADQASPAGPQPAPRAGPVPGPGPGPPVVKRLDPELIPGAEQLPRPGVPDGEREHATQSVHHVLAHPGVDLQQHLGVRGRAQRYALLPQFLAEFQVVVDLAVVDHPVPAVRGPHRLVPAGRQVDDRQPTYSREPRQGRCRTLRRLDRGD